MLLVLNVPSRTVMDLMGWSQLSMTQRYQHVPDQLRRDVADKLGRLLWVSADDNDGGEGGSGSGATGSRKQKSHLASLCQRAAKGRLGKGEQRVVVSLLLMCSLLLLDAVG